MVHMIAMIAGVHFLIPIIFYIIIFSAVCSKPGKGTRTGRRILLSFLAVYYVLETFWRIWRIMLMGPTFYTIPANGLVLFSMLYAFKRPRPVEKRASVLLWCSFLLSFVYVLLRVVCDGSYMKWDALLFLMPLFLIPLAGLWILADQ